MDGNALLNDYLLKLLADFHSNCEVECSSRQREARKVVDTVGSPDDPPVKKSRSEERTEIVLYFESGWEDPYFFIPYANEAQFLQRLQEAEMVSNFKFNNACVRDNLLIVKYKDDSVQKVYTLAPDSELKNKRHVAKSDIAIMAKHLPFVVVWKNDKFKDHRAALTPPGDPSLNFKVLEILKVKPAEFKLIFPLQCLLMDVLPPLVIEAADLNEAEILDAIRLKRFIVVRNFAVEWDCVRSFTKDAMAALTSIAQGEAALTHRKYKVAQADQCKEGVFNATEGRMRTETKTLNQFLNTEEEPAYLLSDGVSPNWPHPLDEGTSLPLIHGARAPGQIGLLRGIIAEFGIQSQDITDYPSTCADGQFFLSRGEGSLNMHFDGKIGCVIQLAGSRTWYIYHPDFSEYLVPGEKQKSHYSPCLPQKQDVTKCKGMQYVPVMSVSLNPGDLAICPNETWHAVKWSPVDNVNCNYSCSMSFAIKPKDGARIANKPIGNCDYPGLKHSCLSVPLKTAAKPPNCLASDAEWDKYISIAALRQFSETGETQKPGLEKVLQKWTESQSH